MFRQNVVNKKKKVVKEEKPVAKVKTDSVEQLKVEIKNLRQMIIDGSSTGQFSEVVERMEKIVG